MLASATFRLRLSLDFMPASLYYVYRKPHAVVVFKFKCLFMTATNTAAAGFKCVTSADVGSGVAECDPQSIWNPRKSCGSFVDSTLSES